MHRTVTVVAATTGATADVRLPADDRLPLTAVLRRLRELTGAADDAEALRNGSPVDLRLPTGDLADGDVLVLAAATTGPSSSTPEAPARPAGDVVVRRQLRPPEPAAPERVVFPPPPAPPPRSRVAMPALLVPLVAGVGIAVLLRRWELMAFALMSPLMVAGQAAGDRWSARRTHARARHDHHAAVLAAERRLRDALVDDRRRRERAAPHVATCLDAARSRTSLLWQRRPDDDDVLRLRLGRGSQPAGVSVEGRPAPTLDGVPVCIDVAAVKVVGVCGDDAVAAARSLVVQAAVLHGPSTLQVTVLAPGHGARWAWARWLPHLRACGGAAASLAVDDDQVRRRLEELRAAESCRRLVVVDGVRDTGLAAALAGRARTSVLWVATVEAALPAACGAVVTTTPTASLHTSAGRASLTVETVPAARAEQAARSLAPLRDTGIAAPVPSSVRWSQLHGVPLPDTDAAAADLLRRWRHGPSTEVRIGAGHGGAVTLDLHRDGPHVLVAGTTGSGKSELLQSLVAGLVAGNAPADLRLLLVDFKGGAAFGACTRLPHTAGVLTDLDTATTRRALTSLSAELRRREQLLAAAGAPDATAWHRERHRRCAPTGELPRLVIVVDEFAALREELPDFVDGLVAVAQRGRSLGVHLVLATQRPEGAVCADIRANTRLRICLAVAREADSRDVVDSPLAAQISRTTPGRALLRIDAGDLVEVQTARVAAPSRPAARPEVTVVPLRDWGERRDDDACATPTELELLVAAAARAARRTASAPAVQPWLPPLPEQVALADLPEPVDGEVAIGLLDVPHELRQPALGMRHDRAEPLLLVGGPRSGRTSAAIGVVAALAARTAPDDLHVWAVDAGGGLAALSRLPHTGAVVDARDTDVVERLLTHLLARVQRRRQEAAAGPALLLVVDGWTALAGADADAAHCQELLLQLVTGGGSAGLRVVVTGDRSGLTGRLAAAVADKMCLRLADPADYALAGIPVRDVPALMPPGRAFTSGGLAQLAQVDERTWATACAWSAPSAPPHPFKPLPARVHLRAVAASRSGQLVVGVRGDDLAPVGIDPADVGSFLVAGPPRSGRTTVLAALAEQLPPRRVVLLPGLSGAAAGDPDATARVAEQAVQVVADGGVLLVDDVDLIDDSRVLDQVEAAVRSARAGHGFVVVAGATDVLAASFRGPVPQARRARAGLLLRPENPHDGDLLGVRLPRRRAFADPPGRGVLAVHGRAIPVQVPLPA